MEIIQDLIFYISLLLLIIHLILMKLNPKYNEWYTKRMKKPEDEFSYFIYIIFGIFLISLIIKLLF